MNDEFAPSRPNQSLISITPNTAILFTLNIATGLVNTATTFCYFSSVFLSAQLTTVVNKYFGITVSFAIFAVINSLVFILTWTAIPETHGLSYHKHKQRTQTSDTTADQASLER